MSIFDAMGQFMAWAILPWIPFVAGAVIFFALLILFLVSFSDFLPPGD